MTTTEALHLLSEATDNLPDSKDVRPNSATINSKQVQAIIDGHTRLDDALAYTDRSLVRELNRQEKSSHILEYLLTDLA